jgi:hypothetical protein
VAKLFTQVNACGTDSICRQVELEARRPVHEARPHRPVGGVEIDRGGLEAVQAVARLQGGEVGRGGRMGRAGEGEGGERCEAHGERVGGGGRRV